MKWYWVLGIVIASALIIWVIYQVIKRTGANNYDLIYYSNTRSECKSDSDCGAGNYCDPSGNCKEKGPGFNQNFSINSILNNFKPTPTPGPIH